MHASTTVLSGICCEANIHALMKSRASPGGSSVTATCSSGPTPGPRRLHLAQLPSLTLPDAPSPSAVSTPVMCGAGWRRTLSSSDMSHDASDVGTPTRAPSFGPSLLQQRLSVSSPTLLSPFSEAGALLARPSHVPSVQRLTMSEQACLCMPAFPVRCLHVQHVWLAPECPVNCKNPDPVDFLPCLAAQLRAGKHIY